MKLSTKVAYPAYLLLTSLLVLVLAEFFVVPGFLILGGRNLPRGHLLMGFVAPPDQWIDDVRINSMGFAGDAIALEKPADAIRVLTLGGSSMFNRNLAERLKQALAEATPRPVELLGGALRRHTTWSSVLKYELLSKYDFDCVLIYHGINDLWANHVRPEDFHPDYSHLDPWYKRSFWLDRSIILRLLYNRYGYVPPQKPELKDVVLKRRREGPQAVEKLENQVDFAARRIFQRNLETLVEAIQEDGSTPILMSFAWSIPTDYSWEHFQSGSLRYNNPCAYDVCPVELWGSPGYVRQGLAMHNEIVREIARSHSTIFVDQEALIGRDLDRFGDAVHLSEPGTDHFVRNIVDAFVAQGLL